MSIVKKSFRTLREFSAFLLVGTAIALIWANTNQEVYDAFIEAPVAVWWNGGLQAALEWLHHHHGGGHALNFHFLVNDGFMVLFFGIAGKEVSESFLPGGALSSLEKASMPVMGTLGGVIGPVALFFALHFALGTPGELANAWAVPAATDIAYAWLFAGLIFGRGHPAVTFLLVLAVLDDMIGMCIIAFFYSSGIQPAWLGLVVLGMAACEVMRRMGVSNFWPYILIGGPLSWVGLHETGVHAALALVPIVPFMPHAERDEGLFADDEGHHDTMHNFESFFSPIVDVGLFTFGLANAGVALTGEAFAGAVTWIIFCSLVVGKTIGVWAFAWGVEKLGLSLPEHMKLRELPIIGCVAGIGFTVALFVTAVTLQLDSFQHLEHAEAMGDMLKLGALLSFAAGPIAWIASRIMDVERIPADESGASSGH